MAENTAYLAVPNIVPGVIGWPKDQVRNYLYDSAITCEAAKVAFAALSPAEMVALSSVSVPNPLPNMNWALRGCSESGTPQLGDIVLTEIEPDATSLTDGIEFDAVEVVSGDGFDYTTYQFSRTGADFNGLSFVSTPAPVLLNAARTLPRLIGNNYPFAGQTAQNTALFKRFPVFNTHANKIIAYPGNLYTNASDNELIGRGWTHTTEGAAAQADIYPTNFKRAIESAFYQLAWNAAQKLPTNDPRRAKLIAWSSTPAQNFEGTHNLIDDDGAARLYAVEWVNTFEQADWKGAGVQSFSVNHEVFSGTFQGYYLHSGLMTRAILEEMQGRTDGGSPRYPGATSALSDFGGIVHPAPSSLDYPAAANNNYFSPTPDPDPTVPVWLHFISLGEPFAGNSRAQPFGTNTILANLVKEGKTYAGWGQYYRHTHDDQSLFVKNTDGSYLLQPNGWLTWKNAVRNTVVSGEVTPLLEQDYKPAIDMLYGYYCSAYSLYFFRAGSTHLPMSNQVMAGWGSMKKFYSQFRLNTEVIGGWSGYSERGLDPEIYNRRALNPEWTEMHGMMMYLYTDYLRGWMDVQQRTDVGAVSTHDGTSRACIEYYTKGFHRAANFNWIQDTPWKFIVPKFWCWKQNTEYTEQYWNKPIITGGIATYLNKPTIWLHWAWPCQDVDRNTDVAIWIDKGAGPITPAYRIRLAGRKPGLEWWHVPDAVGTFEPKDVFFQFQNMKDEKVTWRGDYRETIITAHPIPPAFA